MNIKVILKIPGGPNAMLVLDPENSGGAMAPRSYLGAVLAQISTINPRLEVDFVLF